MAGNSLALTERDRRIIAEVCRFGALTRTQTVRLGLFASKTRANERLKRLSDAGFLKSRRQPVLSGGPQFVYLPGRLLSEVGPARHRFGEVSDFFLAHQLGLVDIRISFEGVATISRWLSDKDLIGLIKQVRPDAYLEYELAGLTYCAFIEYDRGTEPLRRIEQKVRAYLDLAFSGSFERTFKRKFFRLFLVADTPGRLREMNRAIVRVTDKVVRLTTLDELTSAGPFSAIWRRPGHDRLESLTGQ